MELGQVSLYMLLGIRAQLCRAWLPKALGMDTHRIGHSYPCTWVRVTTYVDIIDAFRSIFRLFCMLFRLFCMLFAGFL